MTDLATACASLPPLPNVDTMSGTAYLNYWYWRAHSLYWLWASVRWARQRCVHLQGLRVQ